MANIDLLITHSQLRKAKIDVIYKLNYNFKYQEVPENGHLVKHK